MESETHVFLAYPAVRFRTAYVPGPPGEPSYANVVTLVERWDVGLDVEEGRAVDDVHVHNAEGATLDACEAHYGEADGVRPPWVSGREDAPPGRIQPCRRFVPGFR